MGTFTGEVHPAAELLPLMVGDEFEALVDDIRRNGLREPGKVDGDGRLLDGRNRLRACTDAGVPFETVEVNLNGDDPVAYVVSLNVKRRKLSVGATAIAAAKAWPMYEVGQGRPEKSRQTTATFDRTIKRLASVFGVGTKSIQQAKALVDREPMAAEDVAEGRMRLASAYEALRERERRSETQDVKRRRVRQRRPDLAERMDADELTVDEADDLLAADEARERQQRETMVGNIAGAVQVLARPVDHAEALLDELEQHEHPHRWKAADCRVASEFLAALARRLKKGETE